jgi:sensor c-di-GMP phosphodiesterase-like protein
VLAWLAMGLLPLATCLGLSYGLSLYHFRSESRSLATANAQRVAAILESGDALLEKLAQATGGVCSPATISALNDAVFHSVHFREAGIELDGNLVCTSVEMLPPGFDIPNASRKPAARVGRMEILSPTKTIRGGESLILNRPLRADRSHFINLLIDPMVLVDTAHYTEGLQASTFLDDLPNGQVFRFAGRAAPGQAPGLPSPLRAGVFHRDGGLQAVARAEPYPVYTVMTVGRRHLLQHWRTQMQPAVIAGFLLSGIAFLLLRRYLPRDDAVRDLREGIDGGEIVLDYQPIIDARDRRVVGAEALARWLHPKRGVVMPDDFIPLAEDSGLITPLTDRVLERVQRDLRSLAAPPGGFRISINLSRAHLVDSSLLASLDRIFGPDAVLDRFGFEITERELLANVADNARSIVQELTRRGAEVSLDDFGTGYSGLSHLRHLPLHHIKIDRSFVRALDTEAVTASLVENIVALAHSLGMGLIAEGVETEPQRQRLLELGVILQQGWLYSRAIRFEELRTSLRAPLPAGGEAVAG